MKALVEGTRSAFAPRLFPSSRPLGGVFRLEPDQALLVRAALGNGPRAVAGFEEWCRTVDIQDADVSAQRLLPLVVRTLEAEGGFKNDQRLDQFRKVARFTWLKSQLLVAEATPVVAALSDAGIPTLIIKGAAVVEHTGGDLAGRPMDDIDVVVPTERIREALSLATDLGFAPEGGARSESDLAALIAHRHALETVTVKGAAIDLHWHVLAGCRSSSTDDRFWTGAVVSSFGGVPCLFASREDSIVQAIAHAFVSRPHGGLRWASDVAVLVRTSGAQLDWHRVIDTAVACRVGPVVADAFEALGREIDLSVPSEVLARLQCASLTERLRAHPRLDKTGAPRLPSRAESLVDAYEEFIGQGAVPDPHPSWLNAGRFLAHRWALPSERQVPQHAAFVAAGRPWRIQRRWRRYAHKGAADNGRPKVTSGVPTYRLGQELRFDLGGSGSAYLVRGWSNPEAHGVWTIGSEATVTVPLPDDVAGECVMFVRLVPFLVPLRPRLRVDFIVNGDHGARWIFQGDGWQPRELLVPIDAQQLTPGGVTEIRFVIDRPLSPGAANLEQGTRQLGISLHALRVDVAHRRGHPRITRESREVPATRQFPLEAACDPSR